jgi:hypothetical protein
MSRKSYITIPSSQTDITLSLLGKRLLYRICCIEAAMSVSIGYISRVSTSEINAVRIETWG